MSDPTHTVFMVYLPSTAYSLFAEMTYDTPFMGTWLNKIMSLIVRIPLLITVDNHSIYVAVLKYRSKANGN